MSLAVGDVVEGVVSNLTKFGAFVNLDSGLTGLVHISEISDTFVKDVSDVLETGQNVKVKVLSIDDKGKIALSIKACIEKKPVQINTEFEDKLAKFLKDSKEKLEQKRSREKQKTKGNRSRNRF